MVIEVLRLNIKASEHRSWLVYYSLPVLHILPDPYFTHYNLIVAAMHIILERSVSTESLQQGEQYILRFYEMFSDLYGKRVSCTYKYSNFITVLLFFSR